MTFVLKNKLSTKNLALVTTALVYGTFLQTTTAHAEFYNVGGVGLSLDSDVELSYDDNIYSDAANPVDDFITKLDATLRGDWNDDNDYVYVTAQGDASFYSDNTDENNEQYRLRGDWRHLFNDYFQINTDAEHRRLVSMRGNPFEDPGNVSEEATVSILNSLTVEPQFNYKRYVLDLSASGSSRSFENTRRNNGNMIYNSARDRHDMEGSIRPGYIIAPNTTIYAKGEFLARRYNTQSSADIKDTDGIVTAMGVEYDVPNRITVDAWAGYLDYDYALDSLEDTQIPYYGVDANWTISDQYAVRLDLDRSLSPNISSTTSAIITDRARAEFNYTHAQNWLFTIASSYSLREYRHSASAQDGGDRTENYFVGELGVEYDIMDSWSLGAEYEYRKRDSNAVDTDFSKNTTTLFLKAAF